MNSDTYSNEIFKTSHQVQDTVLNVVLFGSELYLTSRSSEASQARGLRSKSLRYFDGSDGGRDYTSANSGSDDKRVERKQPTENLKAVTSLFVFFILSFVYQFQ